MVPRTRFALWFCCLLSGCQEGFDPPSKVDSLRVLAVRAEPASGVPGQVTTLQMLFHDGRSTLGEEPSRPVQIVWLGGCHNPPGRQFFGCYPWLRALSENLSEPVLDTPEADAPPGLFGTKASFQFPVPEDILDSAPRLPTDLFHFGVSYIFFAVCAGELRPRPDLSDRVPLECVDVESGERLGARDFVTGFTTVFTYEGESNQNPQITAVRLGSIPMEPASCESDIDCETIHGQRGLELEQACGPQGLCAPRLKPCQNPCPRLPVSVEVDPQSAEFIQAEGGREVIWVNYYASAGTLSNDTQLVNDRATGFIDDPSSAYTPPDEALGLVRIWATVHDQRGGADYRFFDVLIED